MLSSEGKLKRGANTPNFANYVTSGAIIDNTSADKKRSNFPQSIIALQIPTGPPGYIIPRWQRKIVWGTDQKPPDIYVMMF